MAKRGRKPKNAPVEHVENIIEEQNATQTQEITQISTENILTIENAPAPEKTPKIVAIEQFKELWQNLPHHNYITDKQAREIHVLWQKITGRTDYYSNCSVCTINHIKQIRKIARNEGIEI
jgi:hypothetical protein